MRSDETVQVMQAHDKTIKKGVKMSNHHAKNGVCLYFEFQEVIGPNQTITFSELITHHQN